MTKFVGLFGGTFDPVHKGHSELVNHLIKDYPFDLIHVIPSANPPHRKKTYCSFNKRLEMTRLAFEMNKYVKVDSREALRGGPSYAIDTIISFKKELKESNLFWILGIDSFLTIESWHRWEELLDSVNFFVMSRPEVQLEPNSLALQLIEERGCVDIYDCNSSKNIFYTSIKDIEISSSKIRSELGKEVFNEEILDMKILNFIKENKLYLRNS